MEEEFEKKTKAELGKMLEKFYAEVRQEGGKKYGTHSMISLRSCLNRHLTHPPYNIKIDLTKDEEFLHANHVFDGYLKDNKSSGNDTTKHKSAITDGDWHKLQNSTFLSPDAPSTLQNKVLIDIITHFGRRGREGLRDMKKSTFLLCTDDAGRKYYKRAYNELTKNNQDSSGRDKDLNMDLSVMYEQPDSRCPVNSMMKYLSKLDPTCDLFFPYPLDHTTYVKRKRMWRGKDIWFSCDPVGEQALGGKLKYLSEKVGLSQVYTNHCLRATVTTRLSRMGIEAERIKNVTGHKSTSSLRHYMGAPTTEEKAELSTLLHQDKPATKRLRTSALGSANQSCINDTTIALPIPPAPVPSNQPAEFYAHENAIENAPISANGHAQVRTPQAVPMHTSNTLSSMFAGAQFTNATININWKPQ